MTEASTQPVMEAKAERAPLAARHIARRTFVTAACAALAPLAVPGAWAQSPQRSALPLRNLGLEHLDIVVPDTAASARFYKQVFASALHQQEFRGIIRYFVLLGDLPADRQVGYIAIGAANDRPIAIGHYCALAESADGPALAEALEAAGYPAPQGGFGMIPDPDGLQLQLFTPPAGLVKAATPSPLPVEQHGLLTPLGTDHVLLHVSDLERSRRYYRFVYGEGPESRDPNNPRRTWFQLAANTRVGLEPVAAGEAPRIERFGIKVAPFDRAAVTAGLRACGAAVLSGADEPSLVRFRDNYGITLEASARSG
jgi:catechol 2,3-dioxygenase-like lactoylglutathione lyase family enzyme